ncbi:flavin reductase [Nesterenkonia salmonea]|uniref:Flavin reductase n=1 Tax=Nesterenkonia salmonea TaxID=1804987 RepID=A0A5R9B6X9_9MICC|nr:flavin reductase family protein [Nesterenkonia salmonea]TLP92380.1 flavin reductase [Nesterenkonia salmonea]
MTLTAQTATNDAHPTDPLTDTWRPSAAVDGRELRRTIRSYPSGITVITTSMGSHDVGMTVSSFTEVSQNPPLVLVCLTRSVSSLPAFRTGAPMAINILAHDQEDVAMSFAGQRDEDRFSCVECVQSPEGTPVIQGASAWLSTHIARIIDGGDHVILLAHVNHFYDGQKSPLLYHRGRIHAEVGASLTKKDEGAG